MTGSGTENDPYVVSTWDEFVTVVEPGGNYIDFAANTVINMNEVDPEGVDRTITLRSPRIRGNNSVIKNFASYGHTPFNVIGATIESLHFENIRWNSGSFFKRYMNASALTVSQCKFSGRSESNSILANFFEIYNLSCEKSSFRFEIWGSFGRWGFSNDSPFSTCNFEFSGNQTGTSFGLYGNNCYITGSAATQFNIGGSTNVVDLTTPKITSSSATLTLVNSDKCEDYPDSSGILPVTTEQMKNAEYLHSIGFPIQI